MDPPQLFFLQVNLFYELSSAIKVLAGEKKEVEKSKI